MANVSVAVTVVCGMCGGELREWRGHSARPYIDIGQIEHPVLVEPCSTCVDNASTEGYERGSKEAVEHVQDMVRVVRDTPP